jgi:thiamine pyrophosphate-dependent acetolactate synthase large subunit-like protein
LNGFIDSQILDNKQYSTEFESRRARHTKWRANLKSLESPSSEGIVTVPYLASRLREQLPQDTTFVMEAVTNAGHLIHHLNLTKVIQSVHTLWELYSNITNQPGSLLGSGAGGLGWGGGATLGAKMAKPNSFVCGMWVLVHWLKDIRALL